MCKISNVIQSEKKSRFINLPIASMEFFVQKTYKSKNDIDSKPVSPSLKQIENV